MPVALSAKFVKALNVEFEAEEIKVRLDVVWDAARLISNRESWANWRLLVERNMGRCCYVLIG